MKRLYLLLSALVLGGVLVGCHSHGGYHHEPHYAGYYQATYVSHAPYCGVCHCYHHGACH